jgi:excisionase family DNA binding protein
MEQENKKVLTFKQGCEHLGYKPSYVYKLTSGNILPFSKPNGKCIRFDRDKLDLWMLSNNNTTQKEQKLIASTYLNTKGGSNYGK